MALWRTSRGLAKTVWRHSPRVRLSCDACNPCNAAARPDSITQFANRKIAAISKELVRAGPVAAGEDWKYKMPPAASTQLDSLPALLASSLPQLSGVDVAPVGSAAFRDRITSLTLSNVTLPAAWLPAFREWLALLLPRLGDLELADCTFVPPDADPPALQAAGAAAQQPHLLQLHSFAHTCAWEDCSCGVCMYCTEVTVRLPTLVRAFSALLDPLHLQHLTTDEPGVLAMLGSLPRLTSLHVIRGPNSSGSLGIEDSHFRLLLQHTGLRQVWLPGVLLLEDHYLSPCRWQELRLLEGINVLSLAALPLPAIGQIVVQQEVAHGKAPQHEHEWAVGWEQAWPRLQDAADKLTFRPVAVGPPKDMPWQGNEHCNLFLGLPSYEPAFKVMNKWMPQHNPPWPRRPWGEEMGAILQLVVERLRGPGTLVLHAADLAGPGAEAWVLRPLRRLPLDIDALGLRACRGLQQRPGGARGLLLAELPPHMTRLVVKELPPEHPSIASICNPGSPAPTIYKR